MIHAFLFLTKRNRDRDGHGPDFQAHMHRINQKGELVLAFVYPRSWLHTAPYMLTLEYDFACRLSCHFALEFAGWGCRAPVLLYVPCQDSVAVMWAAFNPGECLSVAAGTSITVYHTFNDEVALHRQHWWKCNVSGMSPSLWRHGIRLLTLTRCYLVVLTGTLPTSMIVVSLPVTACETSCLHIAFL
jgi:hypothetical protein